MRAYSEDLRKRVIEEEGAKAQELAKRFKLSRRTIERWRQRHRENGELRSRQRGGYRRSCLERHDATLRQWIVQEPCLTLMELAQRCLKELGVKVGKNGVADRLKKLGLSFKKNDARRRARAARREAGKGSVAGRAKRMGRSSPGLPG